MAGKEFLQRPIDSETGKPVEIGDLGAYEAALTRLGRRGGGAAFARESEVHAAESSKAIAVIREEIKGDAGSPAKEREPLAMPGEIEGASVPAEMLDHLHAYLEQEQADTAPSRELLSLYPDIASAESFEEIDQLIIYAWSAYRTLKLNLGRSRIDAQTAGQLRARATRVRAALVQKELMLANPPAAKPQQNRLRRLIGSIFG